MIVPSLITKLSDRNRHLMLVATVLAGLIGVAMLLVNTDSFVYWLVLNLLTGSSASVLFPYMIVVFSMKASSPEKTAQLSGLAQTGGYIFAALGPVLFGSSKQLFNSWTPAVLILLVLTIIMGMAFTKLKKQTLFCKRKTNKRKCPTSCDLWGVILRAANECNF